MNLTIVRAGVFLGAFLTFAIQPLVGKRILVAFGGTPAVWATCLAFFQGMLLIGYAYAHLGRHWTRRAQWRAHLLLSGLSACLLPITLYREPVLSGPSAPAAQIVGYLLSGVALQFGLISATSPMLQHWFQGRSEDDYQLYAYSNAGSLLALISYPLIVERALTLNSQLIAWMALCILYVCVLIACRPPLAQGITRVTESDPIAWTG